MDELTCKTIDKESLENSLPSDISEADHIHRYPAKMTPKLASFYLQKAKNDFRDSQKVKLFDPFAGSGTTLLVAKAMGLDVAGNELLKVPQIISKAKINPIPQEKIQRLEEFLELEPAHISIPDSLDSWSNRDIWFEDKTYSYLMALRDEISSYQCTEIYPSLFTSLSQVVWNVSAADPGIMVPTRSKRSPKAEHHSLDTVVSAFKENLRKVLEGQQRLQSLGIREKSKLSQGDAKKPNTWPTQSFDLVLTSPPYGDGIDYRRAVSLQTRFFGLEGSKEGKKIRQNKIGRTSYLVDSSRQDILPKIEQQSAWYEKVKENSEKRLGSVLTYMNNMRSVLKELRSHLNENGKIAFVMGHPEVAGIKVPLTRVLINTAEEVGLKLSNQPLEDNIQNRLQTPVRRSSNKPMKKEYIVEFEDAI